MALAIEDYALIGDCETAALVGKDGSIDWLCWPDFSSPACFASLLGSPSNGRWLVKPRGLVSHITRRYRRHTLVLETAFHTETGVLLLTDFMPIRETHSDIVRIAQCVGGSVSVEMELSLRFDYGRTLPWSGKLDRNTWFASATGNTVYLRTQEPVATNDGIGRAQFRLKRGQQRSFVLTYARAEETLPRRINVQTALQQTERFWRKWCSQNTYDGPWKEAVERSLITLKSLTFRSTGGIVAAPTASLPERLGADRNWDYRYCWLRDATFTLEALLASGYHAEARAWQGWFLRAAGPDAKEMQIVYDVRGDRDLVEREVPWLDGYAGSKPVRTGNAASKQLQLDVYGEVAEAVARMRRAGIPIEERLARFERGLADYVASIYNRPTSGLWERRGLERQFTYSKTMAWLALDRVPAHGAKATHFRSISQRLHRQICRRGFNRSLGSFVASYDSMELDAAVLLMPLFGFLPFADERIKSTIEVVGRRLGREGLIYRYATRGPKREGAFLACTFWMVQNLAGLGRYSDAERLFESVVSLSNDVGLLSEEYDAETRHFTGNFPQALSHIALINAAWSLRRPVSS